MQLSKIRLKNRWQIKIIKTDLENTLNHLENDTDLFIELLCLRRKRFDAPQAAEGDYSKF